jgi:hypothetical protein
MILRVCARVMSEANSFIPIERCERRRCDESRFYGETFIPEKYARSAYADLFVLEKFLFDPIRQPQPIMFFRKV